MTSRYEDALWDEIVDEHYDELADLRLPRWRPAGAPRHLWVRRCSAPREPGSR